MTGLMGLSMTGPMGSVDDGSDDGPISHSIKQVLGHRQRHVEKMKSSLDGLIAYIESTADSDQSGDYDSMRVGEKRSFEDFILLSSTTATSQRHLPTTFLMRLGSTKGCCGALRHSSASDHISFCILSFSTCYSFPFIDSVIIASCCVFITDRLMLFACQRFLYLRLYINALLQSFNNHVKVSMRVAREPL